MCSGIYGAKNEKEIENKRENGKVLGSLGLFFMPEISDIIKKIIEIRERGN